MLKAVTFDLWNTLIQVKDYTEPRVKCLADALNEMGLSRECDEIRQAYRASHEYVHKIWREENHRHVSAEERLNHILKTLSVELPVNVKRHVLKEMRGFIVSDPPLLVEGVTETLEILNPKYKMGIISDTGMAPGNLLRKVLVGYRVLRFFDIAVFSDVVGFYKPHRLMFETALTHLKVKPFESIHIGDLLQTDIVGAKAIGMKAIWFNKKGNVNNIQHKADYEIRKFPEIINILNTIP
ncbi:MAG: HAD family hydrolase [Candidatus Bathyarchaeia archaeon]